MTQIAILMAAAFLMGYAAMLVRLPPLVGYLAAGFIVHAMGMSEPPSLSTLSNVGVTLLLFGIGLKLDVRTLIKREVWLTASIHMVVSVIIGALFVAGLALIGLAPGADQTTLAWMGLALAFSSTVVVMKVLEDRGDSQSLYGRLAIGILIIQDIVAVAFLTFAHGELPSPWAVLLILLWPLSRLLRHLWTRLGHGELQSLFGIVVALVPGYLAFQEVGLKGDLGALLMGVLLSSHPRASELSRSLFHIKELLLVGFFVSIGFVGLPTLKDTAFALALQVLLPLKVLGYVALFRWQRMRPRTAWLAAGSLMNFSEFGLIVMAVGSEQGVVDEGWLVSLSLAVALSFVFSSLLNGPGANWLVKRANRGREPDPIKLNPADRPAHAGDAEALVIGMGRVGVAAYDQLVSHGVRPVGVDNDTNRVSRMRSEQRYVVEADASNDEFWKQLTGKKQIRMAIVAMPRHGAHIQVVRNLRDSGFEGTISVVAHYDDEVLNSALAGADVAFNIYGAAGLEIADQLMRRDKALGITAHSSALPGFGPHDPWLDRQILANPSIPSSVDPEHRKVPHSDEPESP